MAQFVVKVVQNVMEVDGLTSSHPVRIPVEDPQKILEIFDAISYMKVCSYNTNDLKTQGPRINKVPALCI